MTIKQHGGVFGRNPSFNNVSVETLSIAGGALSSTAAELNILDGVTADATELNYLDGASTSAVVASKAVLADASGNIAFPDGKGIDFSATSGTGTSELFDDYEEGTWVPTLTTDGTDFDSVTYDGITYGWYTKVGNVVSVGGRLRTDAITVGSGSGNVVIGGLPFSVVKQSGIAIGYAASFVTKSPLFAEAPQGQAYIKLYGLTSLNANSTTLTTANVSTSSNSNHITFSGVYQV